MDVQEIAEAFHSNGYGIVRNLFSEDDIAEIERQLRAFLHDVGPQLEVGQIFYEDAPGKPIKAIHCLKSKSTFFSRLAEDGRLRALVEAIWPDTQVLSREVMYFGKAAYSGSSAPAHQDNAFQNLTPPEELVCTIAIDEATAANGALCVLKGSHNLGMLPHRPSGVLGFSQTLVAQPSKDEFVEVQLCMKPGDVCLHHTNTVHYSGPNTTDTSRRTIGIGYRTARAKRDEVGWAKYQEEARKLHAAHGATA